MKKKRILPICLSEAWGGLEMAVVKWNEVLDKNGHSNFNICTPETPLAKSLKKNSMHNLEWDSSISGCSSAIYVVWLHKIGL